MKKYIVRYWAYPIKKMFSSWESEQYRVCCTYIVDKGNLISDVQNKHTEVLCCDYTKLCNLEQRFDKSISELERRLKYALLKNGASEFTANSTLRKLLQR